jgi:hypothetical protein
LEIELPGQQGAGDNYLCGVSLLGGRRRGRFARLGIVIRIIVRVIRIIVRVIRVLEVEANQHRGTKVKRILSHVVALGNKGGESARVGRR